MGMWEKLVVFALTDMSEVALVLSELMEVADDVGDREHHGFIEASPEAHPPLGIGTLIEEVTIILCIQQWWEHPKVVTDQHMPEEVSEWR